MEVLPQIYDGAIDEIITGKIIYQVRLYKHMYIHTSYMKILLSYCCQAVKHSHLSEPLAGGLCIH